MGNRKLPERLRELVDPKRMKKLLRHWNTSKLK
jgi:hypothetical protein